MWGQRLALLVVLVGAMLVIQAQELVEQATPRPVVPNIIHTTFIGNHSPDFFEVLAIMLGVFVQRPERVFFHNLVGDVAEGEGTVARMCFNHFVDEVVSHHPSDAGPPANSSYSGDNLMLQHKSDLLRVRVLLQWGGIYIDSDAFIVNRLDHLRDRDCSMGIEFIGGDVKLNNGAIVAKPNATFLQLFLDGKSKPEYRRTSYLEWWGGWDDDCCRKSLELAKMRPDLIDLIPYRLSPVPFTDIVSAEALRALVEDSYITHVTGREDRAHSELFQEAGVMQFLVERLEQGIRAAPTGGRHREATTIECLDFVKKEVEEKFKKF